MKTYQILTLLILTLSLQVWSHDQRISASSTYNIIYTSLPNEHLKISLHGFLEPQYSQLLVFDLHGSLVEKHTVHSLTKTSIVLNTKAYAEGLYIFALKVRKNIKASELVFISPHGE